MGGPGGLVVGGPGGLRIEKSLGTRVHTKNTEVHTKVSLGTMNLDKALSNSVNRVPEKAISNRNLIFRTVRHLFEHLQPLIPVKEFEI